MDAMINKNGLNLKLIVIIVILLITITFLTNFYGGADIYDYSDTAKFFSDKYNAKIRTSHSYLYGLVHTPFVFLFENYFAFKITSLLSLFLIIYSIYLISGRNKKALWLALLSPITWYMAPWISPIQLATLLFLWSYYFIKKYDQDNKIKNLFYSGVLIGLAWAFWDAVLFFIPLLVISFLYDKKLIHVLYFSIFVFIGVLPRLILDQILFGFAFFGIIRHITASLTLVIYGGFYNQTSLSGFISFILVLLFIPVYTYLIFKRKIFKENKKTTIFLILSIILLIFNSQIRYLLLIVPIIILVIYKHMTKKQFIIQIVISLILILLVINPYIIQIKSEITGREPTVKGMEFGSFFINIPYIQINPGFRTDLILLDLQDIEKEYPDQTFVIGNSHDSYQTLADIYWGSNIEEFVSIQDYNLFLLDDPIIFQKEFCSNTNIRNRRDICSSIYIRKAFNDEIDYESIIYSISEEDNLDIEGFKLVKKYRTLSLFEKDES